VATHAARMRQKMHVNIIHKILEETWRPRYRWKDNIQMELTHILHQCVDWTHMLHDTWAFMKTVMNIRVIEKPLLTKLTISY
jgi:hypothetical protein